MPRRPAANEGMKFVVLAVRLARRDLSGALGGFWILIAGIALGVAVMAAIGALSGAALDGVRAGARLGLGGDVSFRLFHRPAGPDQAEFLDSAGTRSTIAELRPLVRRADGTRPVLVEAKGVDARYPLYGRVELAPAMPLGQALEKRGGVWGAAVDAALGLAMGERLRLGAIEVEARAVVLAEPDRAFRALSLGPRLIVALDALRDSGLAPEGAPVYWYDRLKLAEGADPAAVASEAERRFGETGWRIVNAADGLPGLERSVRIGRVMLALVGLSVLLVGGIGVAGAVTAHLGRKAPSIAVLRCLGATPRLVFAIQLAQVMAAALLGVAIGLAGGVLLAALARPLVADWIPIGSGDAVQPAALGAAAAFGLLGALLFALWPLARAVSIPPRHLFRDLVQPAAFRPSRSLLAAIGGVAALLLGLAFAATGMPLLAAAFAGAAGLVMLFFLLLGRGIRHAAGWASRGRGPLLRLALGNLSRPGAATGPVVMALGAGLTVLVMVASVEAVAVRHLEDGLPRQAPALFFLNLPPEAGASLPAPGAERLRVVPFVHARLTRVAGEPVHRLRLPGDVAWVVRGDRGLSWAALPPPGTRLTAGRWWAADHAGPPLASLDAGVAERLGVGVGGRLTLDVLGRPLEVEVANLRAVDWTRLDLDFPILLSPPAEPPPHSLVAAIWAAPEAVPAIERAMLARFPEAPPVRVAPLLAMLSGMLGGVADALSAISGVTILAALIVLAGTVAGGWRVRLREMTMLRVLGARPRQILLAGLLEFVLLGVAASLPAALLGTLAARALVRQVMPEGWAFLPQVALAVMGGATAMLALTALGLGLRALARPPARLLRER